MVQDRVSHLHVRGDYIYVLEGPVVTTDEVGRPVEWIVRQTVTALRCSLLGQSFDFSIFAFGPGNFGLPFASTFGYYNIRPSFGAACGFPTLG